VKLLTLNSSLTSNPGGKSHKTFYSCNLLIFVIS